TAAGLFDVSHMGEFEIHGPQALDLIELVTTNNAAVLADGQAQYSAMAYTSGTVVDDLLVYRRGSEDYLLVVNAGNIQKDFDWIQSHNHFNASLKNISDQVTLLAVQGPNSAQILQSLTRIRLSEIGYYHFAQGKVVDADAIVSRTG